MMQPCDLYNYQFHKEKIYIMVLGLFKYCVIRFGPSLDPPNPPPTLVIKSDHFAYPPSPPPLIAQYLNGN